jgi:hypothetical protein
MYSEMMTVARMYTLSSGCSIPRDEFKANHDGLINDPLAFDLVLGIQ